MRKPTLAFLGFGKPKGESQAADDDKTRREAADKETKSQTDGDDEEDEEDEDDKEGENADDREARLHRNALRAAGDRRGRRAERERLAGIMNGVDPAKAEFALHTALATDLSVDQAKGMIDKAPKGARAQFMENMNAGNAGGADGQPGPGFAASPSGSAGKPTVAGRMAQDLKRRGWIK